MKPIQSNYSSRLKKITKQLEELAFEIQEIKAILQSADVNQMSLDLDLPNVTTTADYHTVE